MKFNINHYVKIKLTDKGHKILREQHEELKRKMPLAGEYREPKVDEKGYTKFQLWDLMTRFGESCSMGLKVPFDTEIIICEEEKGQVKKLVYKYDNSGYYVWRGESTVCAVKHITSDPLEAADFSSLLYPERELPSEAGKLIWLTGTFEEGEEYKIKKEEVTKMEWDKKITFDEWWKNHYGCLFMNIPKEEARKEWDKITEDFKDSDKPTEGDK